MLAQEKNNRIFVRFLFPLFPVKIFKATNSMSIIAVLIALRLVMQLISVPIPAITQTISLSWVPLMIIGWYYGPIYGFFLGAVCDTLSYFIFSGGVWFWMYAIQEPAVAFILGIFGGICRFRRSKENTHLVNDIIFQQLIYVVFIVSCYTIVILWLTKDQIPSYETKAYTIYRYLSLSLISVFFIAMECFGSYNIIHRRQDKFKTITFIYASSAVVVVMLIFSFMLGPISAVAYYRYLHNGLTPPSWMKFGMVYYLVPRLIVQSIKVPIEATLLTSLVFVLDPKIDNMLMNINNHW